MMKVCGVHCSVSELFFLSLTPEKVYEKQIIDLIPAKQIKINWISDV